MNQQTKKQIKQTLKIITKWALLSIKYVILFIVATTLYILCIWGFVEFMIFCQESDHVLALTIRLFIVRLLKTVLILLPFYGIWLGIKAAWKKAGKSIE